jgi:hypothetical protein
MSQLDATSQLVVKDLASGRIWLKTSVWVENVRVGLKRRRKRPNATQTSQLDATSQLVVKDVARRANLAKNVSVGRKRQRAGDVRVGCERRRKRLSLTQTSQTRCGGSESGGGACCEGQCGPVTSEWAASVDVNEPV